MEREREAALRRMARRLGWRSGGGGVGSRGESISVMEAWRRVMERWNCGVGELGSGRKARILWARHLWR